MFETSSVSQHQFFSRNLLLLQHSQRQMLIHLPCVCSSWLTQLQGWLTIHPSCLDVLEFHSCMHASFPVEAYSALKDTTLA